MTDPTPQDIANAETRRTIADRQAAEYGHVLRLALGAFGPGWLPSGRHFLLDHDEEDRCRRTGERPVAAATVFTVRNDQGDKRHFTVEDGRVVEHASYEAGFGPMLLEPHPTRTIEVRGQMVHPHRYSLCWAPFELYEPQTAEQLAAARVKREERAVEREAEKSPLFADQIRDEGYRLVRKGRPR